MPCQMGLRWYVRCQAKILIGQSRSPLQIGMAFERLKLSPQPTGFGGENFNDTRVESCEHEKSNHIKKKKNTQDNVFTYITKTR
jgi:hypothetical protein